MPSQFSPRTVRPSPLILALVVLFFVSGASALIYQVLWVRLLSLSFGITVHAVTIVLASFMAGLALGSLYGGRLAERLNRPLLAYGVIEIVIALVALAVPRLITATQQLYPAIYHATGESEAVMFPVRAAIAFVLLVVPTSLMGATLPIIVKSSLIRSGDLASKIGLLYTVNTAGAIFGAALAGFWLIGSWGIGASIGVAAVANASIGILAIALDRLGHGRADSPATAGGATERAGDIDTAFSPAARGTALLAYGMGGVISFALEVVWTRMLSLALDTSIYAFVTMLTMVLLGIALGSAAVTPLLGRKWSWPFVFAAVELLIAFGGLWAVWAVANLPEIRELVGSIRGIRRLVASPTAFNFVVAVVTILPTTFLIGTTFPIAARIYTAGLPRSSERLGQIYAANVFGAIFGSVVGGFVLLPALGTQASLLLLSLASLALAVGLALTADRPAIASRLAVSGAAVVAFGLLWLGKPDLYQSMFRNRFPDSQVLWFREGLESTVSVVRGPNGVRTLYTNSRGQANDEPNLVHYHRRIAHLPLLVKPEVRDVLIVGLGAGHTAGSILQYPNARVSVVELSDAVLPAAALFADINYGVLSNPRFSLQLGDGRNYLLTTDRRYDMISNDTIQPWDAGATNLYSADYYRLVLRALKPGGVMAQWIGPQDDFQYKVMLRTFASVFPYMTLWLTADLAIGSNQPIMFDPVLTARRFDDAGARVAAAAGGFNNPGDVLSTFVANRDEVLAYVGPGPLLTDDHPMIEYFRSLPNRGAQEPPDLTRFSRDRTKVLAR